jgi:cystathionine beta-lyase family protein involved in aluminum resistance
MNGKQQAMPGYNDDLIMAMAIGIWVRFTTYVLQV